MHFLTKRFVILLLGWGAFASAAHAEEVVFLVRHAEKATGGGNDPDLSDEGRARAGRLREMLKDARVATIFVTELKRTQQTAAPLAELLQLVPKIAPAGNPAALATMVRGSAGNVLVVGHSNTIPDLISKLGLAGAAQPPIQIEDNDFSNFFILERRPKRRLVRLHYP